MFYSRYNDDFLHNVNRARRIRKGIRTKINNFINRPSQTTWKSFFDQKKPKTLLKHIRFFFVFINNNNNNNGYF